MEARSSIRNNQRNRHSQLNRELRISPKLKPVLEKIGMPENQDFTPDAFQLQAIEALENNDVLVTAPTGAGKTWIAEKAIERVFASGGRCWYACPLKALSNSIYAEFGQIFGEENLGILTGDRKENPQAPIIVGTTEILRNQLYDSMSLGEDLPIDLVVLDEAHYLGDHDRGVVWEEVLIYMPSRIRLLLLSATIFNAQEICHWLSWLRKIPCEWITVHKRPVPIYPIFLFPEGELSPLAGKHGLLRRVKKTSYEYLNRRRGRTRFPPVQKILEYLEQANLLPAIFFFKSRSDCNRAVEQCVLESRGRKKRGFESELRFRNDLSVFLDKHPYLRQHAQLPALIRARVGAHHGGQLPIWKDLLETMMKSGNLKAIFSTSTVAAGVNFPARTVVLFQSDRFNGQGFVQLTSTELLQMTGRAGRRRMDRIGFVLLYPGPFLRPDAIYTLLQSPPDAVDSQIKVNFSMVLNLLLSHRPEEVKDIFANSFATYQNIMAQSDIVGEKNSVSKKIRVHLEEGHCHRVSEVMERRQEIGELRKTLEDLRTNEAACLTAIALSPYLQPGRLIRTTKNDIFVVLKKEKKKERYGIRCFRINLITDGKRSKLRSYWLRLEKIKDVFANKVELPENNGMNYLPEPWAKSVKEIVSRNEIVNLEKLVPGSNRHALDSIKTKIIAAEKKLEGFPCSSCSIRMDCLNGRKSRLGKLLRKLKHYEEKLQVIQYSLWKEFARHLRFLQSEGYVTEKGELTADGVWACRLRLDQPILVSECIRKNVFPDKDPILLSALVAPFVNDRRTDKETSYKDIEGNVPLKKAFSTLSATLKPLYRRLDREGFPCHTLTFWPVKAVFMWASGKSWAETRLESGIDEGDLAMLIYRTVDNLRQLTSLVDTHPKLVQTAEDAIQLLLREPIAFG